jgi:hypothetical protein
VTGIVIKSRRARLASLAVAVACFAGLCIDGSATAAQTTTVQCSSGNPAGTPDLQSTLSGVGAGDTVIIDGLCTGHFSLDTSVGGVTLEGAPGTLSGFDGQGVAQAGALLSVQLNNPSPGDTTTLANLTFENAVTPSVVDADAALRVDVQTGEIVLDGDTFRNNSTSESGYPPEYVFSRYNANPCTADTNSILVESSLFTHDSYTVGSGVSGGGAGLSLETSCHLDPVTVTDNQFTDNTLTASSASGRGGGLDVYVMDGNGLPDTLTQTGNVFDSNTIATSGGTGDYEGGGEVLWGIDLTSTGDRFTNNTIPGATGSHWSWGAGLSIFDQCIGANPITQSVMRDDLVAANTIADSGDLASDSQGAGIYLGCDPTPSGNNLSLLDSTVSSNAVVPAGSGAVAGIYGDTNDNLTLANTILYGDSGGSETGGFDQSGSSLTASYSDFCAGSAPATGAGNLCAAPQLGGTDGAQESSGSPTIDAGSDALVPSDLSSDLFGNPRRLNGELVNCTSLAGTVDIGAAEYAPACPATLTLTGLSQTHAKWSEGSAQATISRKHKHRKPPKLPIGTSFAFTLNAQATVTLNFSGHRAGRRVHGLCVAQTRHNRAHHHACKLTSSPGALSFTGQPGANTVSFDGVLQDGARLGRGAYTVSVGAATAGKSALPAKLSFTIAKRTGPRPRAARAPARPVRRRR